jgi:CheY-like chemotaxis protein/HPt (histidine-containing phosphotransfer) domain-containing protein
VVFSVRVQAAPDGPTALHLLAQARRAGDPFQTALLDRQMPGLDGATLARAIRADATLNAIRLILLTPLGLPSNRQPLADLGLAAYLTKPTRKGDLLGSLLGSVPAVTSPATPRPLQHQRREAFRILLAEDNIPNQQVAVGLLRKLGLRVDAVANGQEAIQALTSLPYDLVLMDVQMPELDGLEATRRIRSPESAVRKPRIPIIAMTARAMPDDRQTCLAAGMDDYLTKPVSGQALAAMLDHWLPKQALPEQPAMEVTTCASTPGPEALVFDHAKLLERMVGDAALARMFGVGFLQDIPQRIAALRGFLEVGDPASAGRQAHTIKGASANVGANALRAVAADLEWAAKSGDLDAIKSLLSELQTQFVLLKQAMTTALQIGP